MEVYHKTYGEGVVRDIADKYIEVEFDSATKKFQFPQAFDKFLTTEDTILIEKIEDARKILSMAKVNSTDPVPAKPLSRPSSVIRQNTHYYTPEYSSNPLIGEHAMTIPVTSENEMFELIGYMATPGRIASVEAEVPKDGRDELFEKLFPNQKYRPIEMGDTPSGMPNKVGTQFRINFTNLSNCPDVLMKNMGKGNGRCVGRINKSRFVLTVVQEYGFRFGDTQDVNAIRAIAIQKGYEQDFNRGYSR